MPIIQCDIREGRSAVQKASLAKAITDAVESTINAPREHIYVLVRETPAQGFCHGGAQFDGLDAE
ncbi:tautomerase family protein [uncultured Tateyamaria sp.]|uniref:tautomerase family protein n=1 Tax=uncultured Tateyamaria sp. TaxID=455651 RepID=UPI00262FF02D|nr:tautomerase family protein [uncultured Tateyamaria sp.]